MIFGFEFGSFLQALIGICGITAPFAFWQANLIKPFRDELDANPATRHDAARRLTDRRWWGPYRGALASSLEHLNSWMGKPEAWWQTFHWCLACAFVYPMLTLFLTWTFGVDAVIGELELLAGTSCWN